MFEEITLETILWIGSIVLAVGLTVTINKMKQIREKEKLSQNNI